MLPEEQQFHFKDGTSIGSLEELKKKVESISYAEFYEHVNEGKNDFANWIEHVLQMHDLAERLRQVNSIVETVELLNEETNPESQVEAEQESHEDLQSRIESQLFADLEPKEDLPQLDEPVEKPDTTDLEDESSDEPDTTDLDQQVDSADLEKDLESPSEPVPDMNWAEEPKHASTENLETEERPSVEESSEDQPEQWTAEEETHFQEGEQPAEDQPSVPTREELEAHVGAGKSVTTDDEPHRSVKELVAEQPPHPDHHKFLVKQTIWGFVLGLIAGMILTQMIHVLG